MQPLSPEKRAARKRRKGLVHKAPQRLPQVRNEINVTPLVDVCLVLLIIFMVIIELLARGKEVPLPKTRHHAEEADQNQPIVAMDLEGNVFFDKDEIMPGVPDLDRKLDELKKRIREEWRSGKSKDQRVYVKADVAVEYKKVYPLIMAIHDLGITSIDLGSTEIKDQE